MVRTVYLSLILTGICVLSSNLPLTYAAERQVDIRSLLAHGKPVMLQFGKSWCPRCKSTKPTLAKAAKGYAGKALVVPVDVELNMQLVRGFRIRLIPTQIFLMPDGREMFRHEGILQARQIAEIFSKMGLPMVEMR
jgi:thioredoxin 1